MGKYVNFTNSHFWRKLSPYDVIMGGHISENLIFNEKSLKNQWFFVRFSQNLAKNLNTDVKTFFEILSKKRAFYDVIMGGQTPQNWTFLCRIPKKSVIFFLILTKFGKKFKYRYFNIFWNFELKRTILWRHNGGSTTSKFDILWKIS